MEEIKVGEYVRINCCTRKICLGIGKVNKIVQETVYVEMNLGLPISFNKNEIANHSPNIIDLIEVGDVIKVKEEEKYGGTIDILFINDNEMLEAFTDDFKNNAFEKVSILTHEQYEANCYRLEEQ